jgi:hypothetical protein
MAFDRSALAAFPMALTALLLAGPVAAQAPRSPPVFDQLASPFTDSEVGGIGCAVVTSAAGAGILAGMGGPAALGAALRGVLTPRAVLEAAAATAFVASSACYVGQALAPIVTLGWLSVLDALSGPIVPASPPANPGVNGRRADLSAPLIDGGQGEVP